MITWIFSLLLSFNIFASDAPADKPAAPTNGSATISGTASYVSSNQDVIIEDHIIK
jgi:hypothetical protein